MRKKYVIIIIAIVFISCNKNSGLVEPHTVIYVEDFRTGNMDDYQTIMAAYNAAPDHSALQFANKTYILSHTPIIEKSIFFKGPAVITREDQITYTLRKPADEFSAKLILTSTQGLITTDRIIAALDKTGSGATYIGAVIDISGDTLFLNQPLGKTFGGQALYPAGTKIFKNINFIWIISSIVNYPTNSCVFSNLSFDGNRANNSGSYSWNLNSAVIALTKGTTYYQYCQFYNSPGETIVGHNSDIENCNFHDLNGSAFHTSADEVYCQEDEIHSYFYYNSIENSNQVSTTLTGHSEGAITHSNSGGYYTAIGNTFTNVGESVLGAIYPSNSIHDWGTSNIIFTENNINEAGRIAYLIDTSRGGVIHNVDIEKNMITNMPVHNFSKELSHWPGIVLQQ